MIKIIQMLSGEFVLVDADMYDWFMQWNWSIGQNGYPKRQMRVNGKNKTFYMHRLLGQNGKHTDHIDGDKTNCTRSNVRACSASQNAFNRGKQKDNTSGFKGVHFLKRTGRYQAQIRASNKRKHIGYFATAEEAARAYDDMAKQLHGEFARLNFP